MGSIKIGLVDQVVERRNIRWLCHFTPRTNLENIKQNGLKTRDLLSDSETTVTDPFRFDQFRNAICLSISKPNKWMFEKKQEQGLDLCLLLINPKVLYLKNCLFYPHNAATASYRNNDVEMFKGKNGLENMFSDSIVYQKSGKLPQSIFRFHHLQACETTSDQAEVQCLENIEPEYIDYIFEEDIPLTYDDIQSRVDENIVLPPFSISPDFSSLFSKQTHQQSSQSKDTEEIIGRWKSRRVKRLEGLNEIERILQSNEKPTNKPKEIVESKQYVRQERKNTEYYSTSRGTSTDDECCCVVFIIIVILWMIIF